MTVISVNISEQRGVVKHPVAEIELNERGIIGDAHAGSWHRQVSLLSSESIERFAKKYDRQFEPGVFAENITTKGIDLGQVAILDRLIIGRVELEITQIGKKIHNKDFWIVSELDGCGLPTDGIFARVIKGGKIKSGSKIELITRQLRFKIITLSDRAYSGEYSDRSGPKIKEMLEDYFKSSRWYIEIINTVIPDDPVILRTELETARDDEIDVIITTGGTGIGPRDITPDVVIKMADKIIPGIMDYIRMKHGAEYTNALISRAVAGVMNQSLIYTLPGSVRAVSEYMTEILKTIEHIILMVHSIGHN